MFILFFAVWILLNGRFTLETALFGVVISLLLYLFCCRFMHYSLPRDLETAKRLPRLISLFFVLVWEIMKAGFALLPYIYGGKKPDPAVVRFKTNIQRHGQGLPGKLHHHDAGDHHREPEGIGVFSPLP